PRRGVAWLYAAPTLLFVLGIFAYPIVTLIEYSLENVGTSPYLPTTFAGLSNFHYIFKDSLFITAIEDNLKLFLCVPVMVILAVILAVILYDRPRGWKIYRALLFLPYVLSIPVVGIVFSYLFTYNGSFNTILRSLGLGFLAQDWLGSTAWALPTIGFVIVWKELGFGVIVMNARLLSVSEEYFEAARVDGAHWWRRLWHVALPQLVPAIAFFSVVELINMLSWVFAYIYVMTLGGPQNSTIVTEFYIYKQVFLNNAIGVGAAAGVVLLGVVSILIVARMLMHRRLTAYGYE
ncbi:MAG: carbohydrate ABC transporter permease, partial [Solirubrobacteraceae bacterium]